MPAILQMSDSGCRICAELMRRSLAAITTHTEARAHIASAVISGDPEVDALARIVSELRLQKEHALEQYASHMLTHEREATAEGA